MKGYLYAGASIILVTFAQLAMKWGISHLPPLKEIFIVFHPIAWPYVAWVGTGIFGYLLSMLCWLMALHFLPLNKAYPLLSLSYGLVYCGALLLPGFSEQFSWQVMTGVLLICLGVILICHRPSPQK